MEILVEIKNKILGDSVFWRGPAENIAEIRNKPARELAKDVVRDGKKRVCGMWHVSEVIPGTEIWIVLNEDDSPIFCAGWPEICHEYINDAINEYDLADAGKWKVRRAELVSMVEDINNG